MNSSAMTNSVWACVIAAVVSMIVGPKCIALLTKLKFCQTVSEDVPERHRQQKQGTPTMGGLIIMLGAAAGAAAFWMRDPKVTAVALLGLSHALLGFADDFLIASRGKSLGLKARQKLLMQFIFAIGFVAWVHSTRPLAPNAIGLWNGAVLDLGWFYFPFEVLMIVYMSNAFNLADGLDGLVGGTTAVLAVGLGAMVLRILPGAGDGLSVLAFAVAGGCLGFLWYNCNPAKVFMGDTGSLALGAVTVGIAVAARQEALYLILAVLFIIEALSVVIQVISFKTTGKRPFKMTPIHHHFELSGWAEQKIVVRFWIAQGLICLAVLTGVGVFELWK